MKKKVLNNGFVELVDRMGDKSRILQAARVSTGSESIKGEKKDKGLIRYLYRMGHSSPFEKIQFEFHIRCPIFVARQIMRHRTFSLNEFSARYSEMPEDFFVPDDWREQGVKNHQGSGEALNDEDVFELTDIYLEKMRDDYKLYNSFLEKGVAKEQARVMLPVSQYTEFFMTADLHNLFHFLKLRLHEHAQEEIRVYAQAILSILKELDDIGWAIEVFEEYREIDELYTKLKDITKKDTTVLRDIFYELSQLDEEELYSLVGKLEIDRNEKLSKGE